MSALEVFQNDAWSVRVVEVDGEPWFVAADVARALGYRMASDMTRRLDAEDRGTRSVRTPSGEQEMTVVSEAGLYVAVMGSQLSEARAFKWWVTHDVLPSIRRTGSYNAPALPTSMLDQLELAVSGWREAQTRAEIAEAKVAEAAPKVELADRLMTADGDYSVREAAQALARDHGIDIGQNRLFKRMYELGWIDRKNNPYQHQIDCGRLAVRVSTYDHPHTGEAMVSTQVRVTGKGLAELHRLLTQPATGLSLVKGSA